VNADQLTDAISGIDPNFIDEAAFELHGSPAEKKRARIIHMKSVARIVIPIAAVALLTVTVAVPMIMRGLKTGSSAPAASESAAPPAASESAADMEFDGAMMDTEPSYEAAEAADEAPSYEKTEDAADMNASVSTESVDSAAIPVMNNALCEDGILTITMSGTLPENAEDLEYSISADDDITYAEGRLGDILLSLDPLTLDLTSIELAEGTYTLTIDSESIEFTLPETTDN